MKPINNILQNSTMIYEIDMYILDKECYVNAYLFSSSYLKYRFSLLGTIVKSNRYKQLIKNTIYSSLLDFL